MHGTRCTIFVRNEFDAFSLVFSNDITEIKNETKSNKRYRDEVIEHGRQMKILILELKGEIVVIKEALNMLKNKEELMHAPIMKTERNADDFVERVNNKDMNFFEWPIDDINKVEVSLVSDAFYIEKYKFGMSLYTYNREFVQL